MPENKSETDNAELTQHDINRRLKDFWKESVLNRRNAEGC